MYYCCKLQLDCKTKNLYFIIIIIVFTTIYNTNIYGLNSSLSNFQILKLLFVHYTAEMLYCIMLNFCP